MYVSCRCSKDSGRKVTTWNFPLMTTDFQQIVVFILSRSKNVILLHWFSFVCLHGWAGCEQRKSISGKSCLQMRFYSYTSTVVFYLTLAFAYLIIVESEARLYIYILTKALIDFHSNLTFAEIYWKCPKPVCSQSVWEFVNHTNFKIRMSYSHWHVHGIKGFVIPTKSFVKIGITKIFCYSNKMFSYQQNVWLLQQNFWLKQQNIYLLS